MRAIEFLGRTWPSRPGRKTRALPLGSFASACLLASSIQAADPNIAKAAATQAPGPQVERSHWAFQRLQRPALPDSRFPADPGTPIDRFVVAKLQQRGLSLSVPAEPGVLLRRLSYDVRGLPPSPAEVQEFLNDPSSENYARFVDRWLDSPQYGERWARHWLDVVRFAESHGFETNLPRDNAWPYRDYVIRAFNEDKPYNQFITEQLAGDVLDADEATGFIVGGPWDAVKSPDVVLTRNQRADEVHDMVATTSATFLGLTVGCARCHDHKFDPVTQVDYYRMAGVFAGVEHGDRPWRKPESAATQQTIAQLRARALDLDQQLRRFEKLTQPATVPSAAPNPQRNEHRFTPVVARIVRFTIYDANLHPALGLIEPCLDELEIFSADAPEQNMALASQGARASSSGNYPNSELHKLEHINDGRYGNGHSWISNQKGEGWVQVELRHQARIDRIVWGRDREGKFTDRLPVAYTIEAAEDARCWDDPRPGGLAAPTVLADRPRLRSAVHATQNIDRFTPVLALSLRFVVLGTTDAEGCIDELEIFTAEDAARNVAAAEAGGVATASGTFANSELHKLHHVNDQIYGNSRSWIADRTGPAWVQIDFRQPELVNTVVWARDREGKFSDRLAVNYRIEVTTESGARQVVASSGDRQPYVAGRKFEPSYDPAAVALADRNLWRKLSVERQATQEKLTRLSHNPSVYAGKFGTPPTTHRLHRGDPMLPRAAVAPGVVHGLGPALDLSDATDNSSRRLALARWLSDEQNPLTPRVIVNRVWHYHFGQGIVATPSDFGLNGARPANQELLDWLAVEFMRLGWKLKPLHRLILLSDTYRQASQAKPAAVKLDAENRLLWKFPPRRLEAEAIRDAILQVSGVLDLRMGGPGYDVFEPNDNYVRVYNPKLAFGRTEWRRMIYQRKPRMQHDATFGSFDCPDGGQMMPARHTSTTPLQALNLLNSPFMMQQAELAAQRVSREAGPDLAAQVHLLFQLALQRSPDPSELAAGMDVVSAHGWPALCRAVFNSNEFLYVF